MYIPFLNQDDLILDNNGKIIPGAKIEVFDPVSNNHIDIYTYDGSNEQYTIAENPIYLDVYSRPEHTYFAEKLVLCRLYKYRGHLSDPRIDDDTENWLFVREWNGAFHQDTVKNDTIVFGLTALQEVNTDLGSVNVVGYWNNNDCEARNYVWDSTCTQTPDNGYIVKNNEKDVGRWILKFDGEYLPSTYYGVYPGREANINALLSYVESVGTAGTKTAPGVYFVPGTYDASTVALATSKKLLIDSKTSFTRESIQADDVRVIGGQVTAPICDFYFNENSTNHNISEAHSGWYKTVFAFLNSGAKTLHIDETNHFADTQLIARTELTNKIIEGTSRLPVTYGENGSIRINNCLILGEKLFNSTDKLAFDNMAIKDSWWNVPVDIDFVNNVTARSSALNKILIENFTNTYAYVNAMAADGRTELDLDGRVLTNGFSLPAIVDTLRNCKVEGNFAAHHVGSDILFENVVADNIAMSARFLTVKNSYISFTAQPNLSKLLAYDSSIGTHTMWTSKNIEIEMYKCRFSCNLQRVTNNRDDEDLIWLEDCEIGTNSRIEAKRLHMIRCTTDNAMIKIYPHKTDDVYYMHAYFEDCTFNNNTPIELTKVDTDESCYDVVADWTFLGNTFNGNNEGLRCRLYADRLGTNPNNKFMKLTQGTVQSNVIYSGNIGKCPLESDRGISISGAGLISEPFWIVSESVSYYAYSNISGGTVPNTWRMMTDLHNGMYPTNRCVGASGVGMKRYLDGWNEPTTFSALAIYTGYADKLDGIDNGDLFKVCALTTTGANLVSNQMGVIV